MSKNKSKPDPAKKKTLLTRSAIHLINERINSVEIAEELTRSKETAIDQSGGSNSAAQSSKLDTGKTDLIAEFLTAVMEKDYERAFIYCKLIIQFEPKNKTATEFYQLIYEQIYNPSFKKKFREEDCTSDAEDSDGSTTTTTSEASDDSPTEDYKAAPTEDYKAAPSKSLVYLKPPKESKMPDIVSMMSSDDNVDAALKMKSTDTIIDVPNDVVVQPVSQQIIDFLRAKVTPKKPESEHETI